MLHTAAAVGEERRNLFTAHFVGVDEGCDGHRHAAPPVRIAEVDGVIFIKVSDFCADGRAGIACLLSLSLSDSYAIGFGIRSFRNDFYDVATDLFMNFLGNSLGVTALGKIGYENF